MRIRHGTNQKEADIRCVTLGRRPCKVYNNKGDVQELAGQVEEATQKAEAQSVR